MLFIACIKTFHFPATGDIYISYYCSFHVALVIDSDPWQMAYIIEWSELSLSGLNHGLGYAIRSPDLLDLQSRRVENGFPLTFAPFHARQEQHHEDIFRSSRQRSTHVRKDPVVDQEDGSGAHGLDRIV